MPEQVIRQTEKNRDNEQKPMQGLLADAPLRAILVSVETVETDWPVDESLDELEQLASTAGVQCVDRMVQRMEHPHPSTLLGSGKVQELAELLRFHDCDAVIFDLELRPNQHRNLERELEIQVLDRTALILIIFGQRARTREGRLQVELAQVEYDLPRLTRQWSHLSRQSGGGTNQRGEGEKQIEVDRRLLRRQKDQLEEELDQVRSQRQLHRERRKYAGAPVVALVGYTNAGKSTMLNRLAGSQTLAEDKLFATLDPTTRRVRLAGGQEILFSDTVGFVQRLPTTLVAAFRATLEEVAEADLLVHVVDASHPHVQHQIEAVEQVLEEIGGGGLPMVLALNKADLLPTDHQLELTGIAATLPKVEVSAMKGTGVEDLLRCISETLVEQFTALDVLIPYDRGELVAQFHQYGTIEVEEYEEGGTHIRGHVPQNHSGPFHAFERVVQEKKVRPSRRAKQELAEQEASQPEESIVS
ncbi:GTPase HflX [Dictyobacter aurantiacus]|uniref:GTPase HflX n=1 Tax=Dictyobacter aurantiacus TaxID=1936993 RepID=A0A401ZFZ7_9CHLR|nr:GTPase HflX [Dictyobacter aurantiacus]GCE05801.1 GTPase HflX [Dictyobacter aurantiacus]